MSLFNKMRENNPTNSEAPKDDHYKTVGTVRNLTFFLSEGNARFLNYAYLITGEYSEGDGNITLIYTTHTVILKGKALVPLFTALQSHLPRLICVQDERYNELTDENQEYAVNEISITANM